ncbi:MAG: XdhC/CoxI family protein [Caldisericia bacterium]|jgi:xanthine dehydrogenase accessory factor|nr:XdhC/CoxI family protein [Caldisericia bacterium]
MHDFEIFKKGKELLEAGEIFSIVTIVEAQGSSPGKPGFKMLVTKNGETIGTVGGGTLEYFLTKEAIKAIEEEKPRVITRELKEIGMKCGGGVTAFIDIIGVKDRVYIFGAGHVGYSLYKFLTNLPFQIIVIDDREEFAKEERFPNAKVFKEDMIEFARKMEIRERDFVVVVSRAHTIDFGVIKEILKKEKEPFYLGLIASKNKAKEFKEQLKEEGYPQEKIDKIHSPIGVEINAITPDEIAISIIAEIIKVKNS